MSDKERLSKVAEFHRLRELRAEMEVDEETIGIERVRAIHNANQVCSQSLALLMFSYKCDVF